MGPSAAQRVIAGVTNMHARGGNACGRKHRALMALPIGERDGHLRLSHGV